MLPAEIVDSITDCVPMLLVPDMRATVKWYEAFGFSVDEAFENDGQLIFARLSLGKGSITLSPGGNPGPHDVRLWFLMDRVEKLYESVRERSGVRFEERLYEPFYGGSQFSVSDCNGVHLIFWRPAGVHTAESPPD